MLSPLQIALQGFAPRVSLLVAVQGLLPRRAPGPGGGAGHGEDDADGAHMRLLQDDDEALIFAIAAWVAQGRPH